MSEIPGRCGLDHVTCANCEGDKKAQVARYRAAPCGAPIQGGRATIGVLKFAGCVDECRADHFGGLKISQKTITVAPATTVGTSQKVRQSVTSWLRGWLGRARRAAAVSRTVDQIHAEGPVDEWLWQGCRSLSCSLDVVQTSHTFLENPEKRPISATNPDALFARGRRSLTLSIWL